MGNTLTGQIVAETYDSLLKVTDNNIITGTLKRITDGFGNDTPLLLSSTAVQIDGTFMLPGTTSQYVRGDGSLATYTGGGLTSVGLTLGSSGTDASVSGSPLTSNGAITLNLPSASATNRGLLTSTDWTTFNSKQGALTLTTTGSSGASTLVGSTLNIPTYTLSGLGGVPTTRTLTINGTTYDLSANRSWTITDTGLTSVGLSMPSAFTVSNSPLTSNGTITVTGAGLASQYVRGDGTLANFPTTGGGGSSVSYYMNGSVSQGAILGNTYYEFNKTPIVGAGTDFTISSNGYITQFITDANDPALLEVPGGNWNFEMYFSASSGGGTPSFYVELYKYDGTSFTLIASNSGTPEGITNGTTIDLYTTALAVPQTSLTLTDRLAVRVYVTNSGRTITLHTENSHLCQAITTFSTGINALNSLTKQVQYLAVGTSGTDFAISSLTDTHTFNLPTASATNRGALSSSDWTTFNNKVSTTRTISTTAPLSGGGDLSANRTLSISQATTSTDGYLSSTNWNTFNNKENVLTFSSPLSRSTNTISIPVATSSVNGYLSSTDWTTFNSKGNGTVTSVAALTLGTSGTDLSSSVATGTTTPVITLNVPTASATNRGVLSSADWTTFNNKLSTAITSLNGLTGATQTFATGFAGSDFGITSTGTSHTFNIPDSSPSSRGLLSSTYFSTFNAKENALTFSAPLSRSTNTISIPAATTSVSGHLTSTDWNTFNNKQATITGGATTITTSNLTASRALVSDGSGKVAVATTTSTEIGYVNGVTSAIQTQLDAKQPKLNTFNRQTASYTLVLADAGKIVEMNVASANNLTVPLNSSVAFPIGTEIQVLQYGAGQTTIVPFSVGVVLNSKSSQLKIGNRFTGVTLVKVGTDEWYVIGNVSA